MENNLNKLTISSNNKKTELKELKLKHNLRVFLLVIHSFYPFIFVLCDTWVFSKKLGITLILFQFQL